MEIKKEIVVLAGGGHKGVVKLAPSLKQGYVKGSCVLDFRPGSATLYLIGDNIAEVALYDINCEFEVPFCATAKTTCVLRSSALTMFGGDGVKSEILKRVDAFCASGSAKKSAQTAAQPTKSAYEQPQEYACAHSLRGEPDVGTVSGLNALGDWTKYDGNNFYYAVKPQLDEMFVCYKREEALEAGVQNSKWVHVDAKDGFYVVGILYNGDDPSFICYGVPSNGEGEAPQELDGMCVWLPINYADDQNIKGYWVIYQSASTGEIVK